MKCAISHQLISVIAILAPACGGRSVSIESAPAALAEGERLVLDVRASPGAIEGALVVGEEVIPMAAQAEIFHGALGERFTIDTYAPAVPPGGRDVPVTVRLTYAEGYTASTTKTIHVDNVGKVRAFAVGWHMRPSAGASQESFRKEMERLIDLMRPQFAKDRPNLLVFPEHCDLVMMLSGSRGAEARKQTTMVGAFAALLDSYAEAVDDAKKRMKGGFASSLLLAVSDVMWRADIEVFSEIARRERVFVAVGADVADVEETSDAELVRKYGDPDHPERKTAFVPKIDNDGVGRPYNQTLIFGPDGRLIGRTRKVNLVPVEKQFEFAEGKLEDVKVYDTPAGKLGVAISLDAFIDDYVRRLAEQGAEIVVQNDANDSNWAGNGGRGFWQPLEWVDSILGALNPKYAPIKYDVCPMMTGNLFDLPFDGQTTITAAATTKPEKNLLAVDDQPHTGKFLFLGPWVFPDPKDANPSLTLDERRQMLAKLSPTLLPGGQNEDKYLETIGVADLDLDIGK